MRCVQIFRADSNCDSQPSVLVCALRALYQRDNIARFLRELVGELLVVGDKVGNVDVAVVLLH